MADWAGAYGAGGAAQALEQIVARQFLERKQAEIERAQRAQEAQAQAEMAQRGEQSRQGLALQYANLAADRDERYQDRTQRVGDTNAQMQRQTLQDQIRAKERTEDALNRTSEREDEQAFREQERKGRQSFEQLMSNRVGRGGREQWLNRGGKVVFDVPREGDLPQNSREQGRPVLSSDANRITDIDAALADLADLRKNLPKGSTGLLPSLSAKVPKWAAETVQTATAGLLPAADAQKRQAVVDRVRQIVGKGMEGGVLRKEDEAKYKNIMPGLETPDEQVISMLEGLEGSLGGRREQTLENLGAAGYDVTRFSRANAAPQDKPGAIAPGTRGKIDGVDVEWDGQGWFAVEQAPPKGAAALFSSRSR